MQVDDCDSKAACLPPIPASGRFVNRRRSVRERVLQLLERVRFVVPVTRDYLSPSTRYSSSSRRT